jgi:hypothetical protein
MAPMIAEWAICQAQRLGVFYKGLAKIVKSLGLAPKM